MVLNCCPRLSTGAYAPDEAILALEFNNKFIITFLYARKAKSQYVLVSSVYISTAKLEAYNSEPIGLRMRSLKFSVQTWIPEHFLKYM